MNLPLYFTIPPRPFSRFNTTSSPKEEEMRTKTQYPPKARIIICGFVVAFVLLFALRSKFYSQSQSALASSNSGEVEAAPTCPPLSGAPTCTKIPPTIVQAILHYSTSSIIPQQTLSEISITSQVLQKKSPCNFLVFGLGHDSLMWASLNHGGRTVFLEEDKTWIEQIRSRFPTLESHHVVYNSKVHQADDLMTIGKRVECTVVSDPRQSKCSLALKTIPDEIYEVDWDLIMVDAPTGFHENAPGRMSAIYTAGLMARNKDDGETDVFVHDVDRIVEDKFSKGFLCEKYMRTQEGRLRHFIIPSHRGSNIPFCP